MKYVIDRQVDKEEKRIVKLVDRGYGVEVSVNDRVVCYLSHEKDEALYPFKVWDDGNKKWLSFSDKGRA